MTFLPSALHISPCSKIRWLFYHLCFTYALLRVPKSVNFSSICASYTYVWVAISFHFVVIITYDASFALYMGESLAGGFMVLGNKNQGSHLKSRTASSGSYGTVATQVVNMLTSVFLWYYTAAFLQERSLCYIFTERFLSIHVLHRKKRRFLLALYISCFQICHCTRLCVAKQRSCLNVLGIYLWVN